MLRTLVSVFLAFACLMAEARVVSLQTYARTSRVRIEQRLRSVLGKKAVAETVNGVVTFAAHDCFFIQSGKDAIKVISERGSQPVPGDCVDVVGRPSLEGGRIVLLVESWKKTGVAELPQPQPATGEDLSYVGEPGSGDEGLNGVRVCIEGRAIGLTETGFAVDVDSVPVTVVTDDLPGFLTTCDRTHPKVHVTGVVELILDESALVGRNRYVMGVRLRISSSDAIVLEPDVIYLANCRDRRILLAIVAVIAALAVGLVLLFVYTIRQSRRQLRARTLSAERKRMADDLHDTIEQHLVGAGMLLQLGRTKEAREILVRAKREMRDIVWNLKNDDMIRLTPSEMIRQLAKDETQKGICRVSARLAGLPEQLGATEMRDLSLVVRESIGNAIKHGGAKKIAISSDPLPDGGWLLRIANDGEPFEPSAAPGPTEGHFGLEGMRERGRRLGATLTFEQKGEWTVVRLEHRVRSS